MSSKHFLTAVFLLLVALGTGCAFSPGPSGTSSKLTAGTANSHTLKNSSPTANSLKEGVNMEQNKQATTRNTNVPTREIYLAGGCFWGTEKLMSSLSGVVRTTTGYANSSKAQPSYEEVCSGSTGARETVKVEYDPEQVSLETVLFAYFSVLDPTVANQQGNDHGSQYQTGIYYTDAASQRIVEQVAAVERKRWPSFKVELKALENFYPAEDYHQQYLTKNPGGYCHISPRAMAKVAKLQVDAGHYQRPDDAAIKAKLTPEQYQVTQSRGTEAPFTNQYDALFQKGIYVDIVTGEPLFLSADKFDSGCGWPAFSKPIDPNVVVEQQDRSLGMTRTEVTSRTGSTHLGHVFYGEGISPTDVRYCIDSASLRFIAYENMDKEGYGAYKKLLPN